MKRVPPMTKIRLGKWAQNLPCVQRKSGGRTDTHDTDVHDLQFEFPWRLLPRSFRPAAAHATRAARGRVFARACQGTRVLDLQSNAPPAIEAGEETAWRASQNSDPPYLGPDPNSIGFLQFSPSHQLFWLSHSSHISSHDQTIETAKLNATRPDWPAQLQLQLQQHQKHQRLCLGFGIRVKSTRQPHLTQNKTEVTYGNIIYDDRWEKSEWYNKWYKWSSSAKCWLMPKWRMCTWTHLNTHVSDAFAHRQSSHCTREKQALVFPSHPCVTNDLSRARLCERTTKQSPPSNESLSRLKNSNNL